MKQFDREGREMFFFWDREEITDIIATEFDSIGRPVKVVDVSGQRLERFTYTYEYW